MPYITVDEENTSEVRLYYEDHGEGQPVVLIHGYPLNEGAWEKQKLALVGGGYRTISYDRRGFGQSDKPAKGYDYDTMARDLNRIVTRLDLTDIVLVGHSMGTGEVARYIGTYGTGRVDRAVFIAPILPYLAQADDNPEGADPLLFEQLQEAVLSDRFAYLTAFFRDFYNMEGNQSANVSDELVRANWNTGSIASPRGMHDCIRAWTIDFREDINAIDVPTLIIQGDTDRILPIDITGRRLHKLLKGSRLVVVKGGPHGIPWTHAEQINHELLEFLARPADEMTTAREGTRFTKTELAFRESLEEEE